MADFDTIQTAIGDALRRRYKADLNIFDEPPRSFIPPAAIVRPRPHRTVMNYQMAHGRSSLAKWQFDVLVLIGLVDDEASMRMAKSLISPGSPLIKALNCRMLNGFSQVVDSGTNQMMIEDKGLYTYAEVGVQVLA